MEIIILWVFFFGVLEMILKMNLCISVIFLIRTQRKEKRVVVLSDLFFMNVACHRVEVLLLSQVLERV